MDTEPVSGEKLELLFPFNSSCDSVTPSLSLYVAQRYRVSLQRLHATLLTLWVRQVLAEFFREKVFKNKIPMEKKSQTGLLLG